MAAEDNVCFSQSQIESVAAALGHTSEGLTGSEIALLLKTARMDDPDSNSTKRIRLYNAFAKSQNEKQKRTHILAFIRFAMKPARFIRTPERFEPMRANLNMALAFAGLAVDEAGKIVTAEAAQTLSAARRRAQELRADLSKRDVHPDVLAFCRAELLADDYFHAVLEAVKSVLEKIRTRTGLTDDGDPLIVAAFAGDQPLLAINALRLESERSEQKGFANLLRGTCGMFRNPTAHAPRVTWSMTKADAEDLFSLVSLIHRRIDAATFTPRPNTSI